MRSYIGIPLLLITAICGASACGGAASPPGGSGPEPIIRWDDSDVVVQGELPAEDSLYARVLDRTQPELTGEGPAPGVVVPYPLDWIIGTYSDCRGGGRTHRGLDIAGVGENMGLGDSIYSMFRSEIVMIGRSTDDPERFGRPDTRSGDEERAEIFLPRSEIIAGYGEVHFFTRNYGSWHSGTILVARIVGGEFDGYQVRYMHLADVHPGLQEGDIVEAGQEIGLMGGTAVMHDPPHVHIDIEDLDGDRVDVAPLLGLEGDPGRCRD